MLIYKDLDDFSYFFAKTELELIRLYLALVVRPC